MTGIGLFLIYIGYAIFYWSFNSMQGKSQDPFIQYLLPFASGGGASSPPPRTSGSPTGASNQNPSATRNASSVQAKIKGQHL